MTKINEEFNDLIKDIIDNKKFNRLKKAPHHGINRYEHSYRVAKWTYKICRFLKMKRKNETTRAALLHDFYEDKDLIGSSVSRLGNHPEIALENSVNYYKLDTIQKDIIKSHMFPCTHTIPKYKESWLVSMVDKIVGTYEMLRFKAPLYTGVYAIFLFELIKLPR